MATSPFSKSSSQVWPIPLLLLLATVLLSIQSAYGQKQSSSVSSSSSLPDFGGIGQQLQGFGSGLLESAQNFGQQLSGSARANGKGLAKGEALDSSSFSPDKMFTRVREGFGKGVESLRSFGAQLMDPAATKRMTDRTMGLLDRIMGRFDKKKEGGGEGGKEVGVFNNFLASIRNTVQRISNRMSSATTATGADGKKKPKIDESDAETIAELNAALKQLDKATKSKKATTN